MKLNPKPEHGEIPLKSEGKLLEVIPVIIDASGQPYHLPPVIWEVDNWLVGYEGDYITAMPMTFGFMSYQIEIPGASSRYLSRMTFICRLMERTPGSEPYQGSTIDIKASQAIIDAIKQRGKSGEDSETTPNNPV